MGRPLGAKNKRTLLREANMKEAATRARLDIAASEDELIWRQADPAANPAGPQSPKNFANRRI
jgi:hypothetical protein